MTIADQQYLEFSKWEDKCFIPFPDKVYWLFVGEIEGLILCSERITND